MSRNRRARKHARSALRLACERLEGRALLSGARAAILPPPLEVSMGAPSPFFLQQSGSAQITLTRSSYSAQGTLSVVFSTDTAAAPDNVTVETTDKTIVAKIIPAATPGQQYLPVDETLTFQPGQTALSVSVPIVPNAANPGIVVVEMTTTPLVTGGTAENGYFAIVSGPDQLPLTINNAQIVRQASGASAIALTFNEPLAPASVESLQNYRITPEADLEPSVSRKRASSQGIAPPIAALGGPAAAAGLAADAFLSAVGATYKLPQPARSTPLQSAMYNAATNTVTLVTTKPLNPSRVYQVAIGSGVGTAGLRKHNSAIGDLTSLAGNSLSAFSPSFLSPQSSGGNPVNAPLPTERQVLGGDPVDAPLPTEQPPGGNLVDLTSNPFASFMPGPISFNVSSGSSGPPQVLRYSAPSTGSMKYTFGF